MLSFSMFSRPASPTNRSRLLYALSVSGFSSPDGCRFNARLSTVNLSASSLFSRYPVPNPFVIRTSAKRGLNFFTLSTSGTKDLKPFRIRTYEKRGRGPLFPSFALLVRPTMQTLLRKDSQ
jgi:hypothetical protein